MNKQTREKDGKKEVYVAWTLKGCRLFRETEMLFPNPKEWVAILSQNPTIFKKNFLNGMLRKVRITVETL